DPATALGKAETLRRLVADTPTPMGGFAIPITVSIGMAELAGTRTLADSLEQADRALYRAKETGRNRVAEPEFA
ncbi:MAG: diguanylate cyclase, partial [Xanthomonas perforans]|nr:diguanylate cyclase [Xanthomonas perforans]NEL81120.1 diguanylate cyclase [Xanthomonas perforans]